MDFVPVGIIHIFYKSSLRTNRWVAGAPQAPKGVPKGLPLEDATHA
jgi:hypothetical protein